MEISKSNPTTAPLLRLPGELRNQIYEHLLGIYSFLIQYSSAYEKYRVRNFSPLGLINPYFEKYALKAENMAAVNALLRTNRQIYNELHPMLYRRCILSVLEILTETYPKVMKHDINNRLLASIRVLWLDRRVFDPSQCPSTKYAVVGHHAHMADLGDLPNLEKIVYPTTWILIPSDYTEESLLETILEDVDIVFGRSRIEVLFERRNVVEARRRAGGVLEVFKPMKELIEVL